MIERTVIQPALSVLCATCAPFAVLAADSLPVSSFEVIESAGLENACYPDADHYAAEFLYQHPDVCFWEIDRAGERVLARGVPAPPADAVLLPLPSSGDDTAVIAELVAANAGGALVGRGVYTVGELHITVPIDIFQMPMVAAPGADSAVVIESPDVRLFDSPVDGAGSASVRTGYRVETGSDRFTLVGGGFGDVLHRQSRNVAGVSVRGADDIHLACNTFHDILNDTDDPESTSRANAILLNGGGRDSIAGGVIANNRARELQSNGQRQDAEFLTIQSYTSTDSDKPLRVFANRTIDAGKRFTKHQEDDALVLSNEFEWTVKAGPLGDRKLLSHVEIQFSDDIVARNNRVRIGAESRFDYVFNTDVGAGEERQRNVRYDCNDIEIRDRLDLESGNRPHVFVARASRRPRGSTDFAAKDSGASGNRVRGEGSVSYHYWFGEGYPDDGGRFEHDDNVVTVPALEGRFKSP